MAYDYIFTDLNMTEMNGLELIKKIKNIKPDSIIYLTSGENNESINTRALELGAKGIINKPFKIFEITSLLEN